MPAAATLSPALYRSRKSRTADSAAPAEHSDVASGDELLGRCATSRSPPAAHAADTMPAKNPMTNPLHTRFEILGGIPLIGGEPLSMQLLSLQILRRPV